MSHTLYTDLVSLRRLGSGRVIFACNQALELLGPHAPEEPAHIAKVRRRLIEARDQAQAALDLDRQRQSQLATASTTRPVPALKPTDVLADRLLGSAHRTAKQATQDFDPQHPRHQAGLAILHRLFPQGVTAIIHRPAVEQLVQMQTLLRDCEQADIHTHIQTLGLSDLIERLRLVTADYGLALQPSSTENTISGAQVIDAQRTTHDLICRAVAVILGTLDEPADAARRDALLAPILLQHSATFRARQAHNADIDIDPTTGHDLPS